MAPSETIAFLKAVLPEQGLYVAVLLKQSSTKAQTQRRQIICQTIEELANVTLSWDRQGWDAYHACATYKEAKVWNERRRKFETRSHANVRALRSLFVDLDVGPGKPYASGAEAYAALGTFCAAAKLTPPIVVGSGHGLHCYWPLEQDTGFTTWTELARGLKQLCVTHGLHADPSRTADASSILRTPGTHNYKNGGCELVQSSKLDDIHRIQPARPNPPRNATTGTAVASQGPKTRQPVLDNLRSLDKFPAAEFGPIARDCAHVAAFNKSGDIAEPLYHANLGVLVHCRDGEAKAHELSANDYPGYSYDETQARIERLRDFGPTTCAKFHSLEPSLCERCPHFGHITSPAQLGNSNEHAAAKGMVSQPEPTGQFAPTSHLPTLPKPFLWSNTGQLLFVTEDNHGPVNTVICEHSIYFSGVQRAEVERESFSYCFRRLLPHEGWETIVISAREMHGPAGLATMQGKGVNIHDPKMFLNYVRLAVDDYNAKHGTQTRFEQFGWKNEDTAQPSFFYGRYLYTAAGPVEVTGSDEVEKRVQYLGPRKAGSIHVWTEAVDTLFARQMESFGAVVVAGFAAVLLRFLSALEGGAWVHLFTPNSGKGKSTALQGAWTVWGSRLGTSLSEWDTKVGKFTTLGVMSNLPVIYDEINSRDPEALRDFIMIFSEGRDRIRGKSGGGTTFQKSSWSTIGLSGSNSSVLEQLPQAQGNDAACFRVLELMCELDAPDRASGDRLKDIMEHNAGFAGDVFIRYLVAPGVLPWAREALDHWTKQLWEKTGLPNEHRFRIRLVAAIAVAGAIVSKLELLHFNQQRIVDYLIGELKRPHNKGSVSGMSLGDRSVNSLGDFINQYQGEILQVVGPWRPKQQPVPALNRVNGRISMRAERASRKLYISESVFKDWCTKMQLSPRVIYSALTEQGILLSSTKRTLTAGTDLPGAQVHCLEINLEHPRMGALLTVVAGPEGLQETASRPVPLRPT